MSHRLDDRDELSRALFSRSRPRPQVATGGGRFVGVISCSGPADGLLLAGSLAGALAAATRHAWRVVTASDPAGSTAAPGAGLHEIDGHHALMVLPDCDSPLLRALALCATGFVIWSGPRLRETQRAGEVAHSLREAAGHRAAIVLLGPPCRPDAAAAGSPVGLPAVHRAAWNPGGAPPAQALDLLSRPRGGLPDPRWSLEVLRSVTA